MFKNLFLAILLILPLTAIAHSPLDSSFPSDGEKLDTSSLEIIYYFTVNTQSKSTFAKQMICVH